MPVNIVCPNFKCKALLAVEDKMRGQTVRCTNCGQLVRVPARIEPKKK